MGKLIINEMAKIFRRPGTIVMFVLVFLFVAGIGAFYKYDEIKHPPKENKQWKQELRQSIKENEEILKEMGGNITYGSYLKQEIAINEYRLENNLPPETNYNIWSFVRDAEGAIALIGIFMIIVAAGIVASEFSWGTIKLLLVRPMSRAKILLSKYLTTVLFGLALLSSLFILSAVAGLILFGMPEEAVSHLAFVDGEVVERSIILQLVVEYLLSSIDILMIATMAFMVSSVFRNSNLAIGISLFLLFMGGTVTGVLAGKFEWAKYILFANTDLTVYFDGTPLVEGMTLTFSVTMLVAYFVLFLGSAFLVFSKRDVAA